MKRTADEQLIEEIITREGGYVNHPDDRGGPTKFGITLDTLRSWKPGATIADVQQLTRSEAARIYKERFINRFGVNRVNDDKLRALLADWAVHSGGTIAIRTMQTLVGVTSDGILGPRTAAAINSADAFVLRKRFLAERMKFIARFVKKNPKQLVFLEGFYNRLAEMLVKYV